MGIAMAACVLLAGTVGAGAAAAEYPIDIKTDLDAKYYVVKKTGPANFPTLVVKRVRGDDSTTYTKRIFDCTSRTVQRLGSGPTLKAMEEDKYSGDAVSAEKNTIGGQLWRHACRGK